MDPVIDSKSQLHALECQIKSMKSIIDSQTEEISKQDGIWETFNLINDEKDAEIKGYVPKYNSAVINKNNVSHSTSIISPTAPKRETLQIFFE